MEDVIHGDRLPEPPPIPGDGLITYFMEHEGYTILARLEYGQPLAKIWSWHRGDNDWVRCYAC